MEEGKGEIQRAAMSYFVHLKVVQKKNDVEKELLTI